jgi:uncharacterized membrane protein YkvI
MNNQDSSSVSSTSSSNHPNSLEAELLRIRRRLSWLTTAIFFLAFAFLLFVAAAYGAIVDYHASEGKLIAGACTGGTVMGFLFGWLARRAG